MGTARKYWVYILTNQSNTVLYIGVTGHLQQRVHQHRTGQVDGFTKRYNVKKLVYAEEYSDVRQAIRREKQLKNWRRVWKVELIEESNPDFDDLYETL